MSRWAFRLALLALIVDLFYVALIWPDWERLATGPIPRSKFMDAYQASRRVEHNKPRLRWQPVTLMEMPAHLRRAVIVAEDSRFYQHRGFDLIAFKEAMDYNVSRRRFALGASTISQQTVKNLLLSGSRNPLRKWHELLLTWGMERNLTKNRILEIYLNVAEFGPGIYGVEAAARAYWGKPVSTLTPMEAAELAATLPSPKKNNPATRTPRFQRRVQKITGFLAQFADNP